MKVLLTGVSSFTGAWFGSTAATGGLEVFGTATKPDLASYSALQRERLEFAAASGVHICTGTRLGDENFFHLLSSIQPTLLCLHGATVNDHKDKEFDPVAALLNNTYHVHEVLRIFKASGGQKVILTGTYFEAPPDNSSPGAAPFSPYGLSKCLTWQVIQFYCRSLQLPLAKFDIPNPIGRYERRGLLPYLLNQWQQGAVPILQTPDYVRDFVPVPELARRYVSLLSPDDSGFICRPSGWVHSIGAFTANLSQLMQPILNRPCEFRLARQENFDEPRGLQNSECIVEKDMQNFGTDFWTDVAHWNVATTS